VFRGSHRGGGNVLRKSDACDYRSNEQELHGKQAIKLVYKEEPCSQARYKTAARYNI
jgi:hypothetical protein